MLRNYRTIRIFAEKELQDFLEEQKLSIIRTIEDEKDDYLLNVNETNFIQYKLSQVFIEPLEIHKDQIYASSSEQMIPAENFPTCSPIFAGKSYKKDVIKFHIPFSGNSKLLFCRPSRRIPWTLEIELLTNEFCFEIINFNDDVESIKKEKDSYIEKIVQISDYVSDDINSYNTLIGSQIKQAFDACKKRLLAKNKVLTSIGVPFKKSDNISPTFSVPLPQTRKKVMVSKPVVNEEELKLDPTLDESAYIDILKLIHDVGKEFERLPSLYSGKEEEHLRDHFLMMLEPNFQGSATGETFNKIGKTDILLRYEGSNVFIAECKFWRGQLTFLETITQLLSYLTWRDSKAAVIVFVSNKDFSSVLQTMKESISRHSNYLEYINSRDETWFNYKFHINNDRNRQVKLAVMLYHIPKISN